jgi:hypothetical protein
LKEQPACSQTEFPTETNPEADVNLCEMNASCTLGSGFQELNLPTPRHRCNDFPLSTWAIVSRPRILLFDEATSALDNQTQALVSESLKNLKATRIVVAHRLSTILRADCIYVMAAGRVVQRGTYEELMRQPGLFADLAKRQV